MEIYDYLWKIQRTSVEQELGRELTSDEWTEFKAEFEGRMDNYGHELYTEIIEDLQRGRLMTGPDIKKPYKGEIW